MKFYLYLIVLLTQSAYANFSLNPDSINNLDFQLSPLYLEADSLTLDTEASRLEYYDSLNWRAEAKASVTETNEQPLIIYQPIISPVKEASIGVSKKTKYGVDFTAGVGTLSQKFDFQNERQQRVTTIVEAGADIDLNKDFLGRSTKAQLEVNNLNYEQSKRQRKIQLSRIRNQAQQIYWSMVANRLKKSITEKLKASAKSQLADMKDRKSSFLADSGDVATYTYQLAERNATGISLDYELTQLEEELKAILPQLRNQSLEIEIPDPEPEIQKALVCINEISKAKDPLEFSLQDEILNDIEDIKNQQVKIYDDYNKPDIKLHTRIQTQGIGGNTGGSVDDFTENNRLGYTIGASINFSLGSELETKKAKVRAERMRFQAKKETLISNLNKTHSNVKKTVVQLMEILEAQKTSNKALNEKIKVLRKKYEQARISLVELTVEEDKQINTELSIIDTRLRVLNTLFQYFDLYTETPCVFNKAKS